MISNKAFQISMIILTLIWGGAIYLLFREKNLLMFKWISYLKLEYLITDIRGAPFLKFKIPNWALYSLPDGLWLFSFTSTILLIWKNKINSHNIIWLTLIPLIAIVSELGQAIHVINGTFDYFDLLSYLSGSLISFLLFSSRKYHT